MGKPIDLTGQKFGRLTIIRRSYPNDKFQNVRWLCKCECDKETIISGNQLKSGNTRSCGCLRNEKRRVRIDLTGEKFGKLMVVRRDYSNEYKRVMYLCKCDCGEEKIISGGGLRKGTKSCGCLNREYTSRRKRGKFGEASKLVAITKYKVSAKKRGLEYNLTNKQFLELVQQDCYYCGDPPQNIIKNHYQNGDYFYNGIDRIDNNKGYTIENTVPCCAKCNYAKSKSTLQEFKDWIERAYNKMFGYKVGI